MLITCLDVLSFEKQGKEIKNSHNQDSEIQPVTQLNTSITRTQQGAFTSQHKALVKSEFMTEACPKKAYSATPDLLWETQTLIWTQVWVTGNRQLRKHSFAFAYPHQKLITASMFFA